MIIDLILDRKDGKEYSPKKFYQDTQDYGEIGSKITEAMDEKTELDVKKELYNYIIENSYNMDICLYIQSVNWL